MVGIIPAELIPAAEFVRARRNDIPKALTDRSRTLVKIRNGIVGLAVGMMVWLPIAIARYTPTRFFDAVPGFLMLCLTMAGISWFQIVRTREHSLHVLRAVAIDENGETDEKTFGLLSPLRDMPMYVMPFGPWFPAFYAPAFLRKWWLGVKHNFVIPH